ncbi:MAG: DUF2279 domain-containing protein [Bacteroidota bacterium]
MRRVSTMWSALLLMGTSPLLAQAVEPMDQTHRFHIPSTAFYTPELPTLDCATLPSLTPHAVPTAPFSSTSDPWLGRDKMQHLAFSFLLTVGSQYVLVNKSGRTERGALPLSASGTAAVGLAKELYDRHKPRGFFSARDLAADGLGILLAVGLIVW